MSDGNIWTRVLAHVKAEIDPEEFRRWLSASSYASDSGDQISVWVPSAADARQISQTYGDRLQHALTALGRQNTTIRFLATGYSDEEDDDE